MSIIKKTALQGFSVSVLALVIAGCGGGGDDSSTPANNGSTTISATLTTVEQMAKAASAIVVANKAFDTLGTVAGDKIEETIISGKSGSDIKCSAGGSYQVTPDSSTSYMSDGSLQYLACQDANKVYRGRFTYRCEDSMCQTKILRAALDLSHTLIVDGFKASAEGSWNSTKGATNTEKFDGEVELYANGFRTILSFSDELTGSSVLSHQGKISVKDGNPLNCIDGEVNYTSDSSTGAMQLTAGGVTAGTVNLNLDGSITVKMTGKPANTVSKATFESYCALSQVKKL